MRWSSILAIEKVAGIMVFAFFGGNIQKTFKL